MKPWEKNYTVAEETAKPKPWEKKWTLDPDQERQNVRRGLNPDGTPLRPGAGRGEVGDTRTARQKWEETATLEQRDRAFSEEKGVIQPALDSAKRGWEGLKSAVVGVEHSPMVEAGAEAARDGDFILSYDTETGSPIYASDHFSGDELKRVVDAQILLGKASAGSIAKRQVEGYKATANLPVRPATAAFTGAKTFGEGLEALAANPLGVVGDIGVQSTVQMAPALLATIATRSPKIAALTAGLSSSSMEYGSGVVDYLAQNGVDISDEDAITQALSNPDTVSEALGYAKTRAGIVGTADALSAGAASKVLVPARLASKAGVREAANTFVAQPIAQMTAGAGGEAAAQLATTGEVRPGEILAEAVGETFTAPVEAGAFAYERQAQKLKELRAVAETPEQVGTLDAGIALAEARAGQAEKKGYYQTMRERANVGYSGNAPDVGRGDTNSVGNDLPQVARPLPVDPQSVASIEDASQGPQAPSENQQTQQTQPSQEQDAIDEAELDRMLADAFPDNYGDTVEQDVSQDAILASRNVDEPPQDTGIEAEELDANDPVIQRMLAEQQAGMAARDLERREGPSDAISEGLRAVAENPTVFRSRLYGGKNISEIASEGNLPYSQRSRDDEYKANVYHFVVDQGAKGKNEARIHEGKNDVWVDVSDLKSGGGRGEEVYSAAFSLARNQGKNFIEDPRGLSDTAMYRRVIQELSGILKADDASNVPVGEFLASQRAGGPKTRPVPVDPGRKLNPAIRERALTAHANAILAVPEVKGIRYDTDSSQFVDRTGQVVTDADFDRLADYRHANPVREAMVRKRTDSGDLSPAPIGGNTLKLAALVETLRVVPEGDRSRVVGQLRALASGSDGLGSLKGILPSRRTEDGSAGSDRQGNRRGILSDSAKNDRAGSQGEGARSSYDGDGQRRTRVGLAPTKEQIRDTITRAFGRKGKRSLDSGSVKVVQNRSEIPADIQAKLKAVDSVGSGTVQAFYHSPSNTTYIVADTIKSLDEVSALFLHEIVHAKMKAKLGDKFDKIVGRMKYLLKHGTEAEKEVLAKAMRRVERAGTPAKHVDEEFVAYLVQLIEAMDAPSNRFKRWLEDVYAAIKLWAADRGYTNLSVKDIHLIARGSIDYSGDTKRTDTGKMDSRVFHGSPHRFDKFTTEKMGTGEGAQAYGWGLYFADKKDIAEHYREALSNRAIPEFSKDGILVESAADIAEAYYRPGKIVQGYSGKDKVVSFRRDGKYRWEVEVQSVNPSPGEFEARKRTHTTFPEMKDLIAGMESEGYKTLKGQLYEVEIPEDDTMLLWDKPLSEQPKKVREALKAAQGELTQESLQPMEAKNTAGSALYWAVKGDHGGPRAASEYLKSLGINGIKYLDGSSRSAGDGSFNYVVFDGSDAQIQKTYYSRTDKDTIYDAIDNLIGNDLEDDQIFSRKLPAADDPSLKYVTNIGDGSGFQVSIRGSEPNGTGAREFFFHDSDGDPIGLARMTGNPKQVSINMIAFVEESRGQGNGRAFYEYLLDDLGVEVKSDDEITDATAGLYRSMARDYPMRVDPDGRVVIEPKPKDTITVDGKERSRLNSDGKPIAGDDEALTNFWRWFGNSKVTDEQGRPKVVYHGTASDVESFDPKLSGSKSNTGAPASSFFFTDAPDVASSYTVAWRGEWSEKLHENGNVIPVYLSINAPFAINAKGESWRNLQYKGEEADINEVVSVVQSAGKSDGLIVKKVSDKGVGEVTNKTATTYVAFKPSQIKSVNNRGTFSPSDDSILASRVTPQDRIDEARRVASDKRTEAASSLGVTGPSFTWELDATRFAEGVKGAFNRLRLEIQDKYGAIAGAQKDIEKVIGKLISDSMNVWRRENLMHGRASGQIKDLNDNHVNPAKDAMKELGIQPDLVEDYFEARAAEARNKHVAKINPNMPDGGAGISTADAKAFLDGSATGHRSGVALTPELRRKVEKVAKMFDAVRDQTRQRLLDSGQITQAQYDSLEPTYAPLRGKDGEEIGKLRNVVGGGIDVRGKPLKRAMGRGEGNRAVNILAEIIGDAERSIVQAEKTRVGQTLVRLILGNPNKDVWEVEPVLTERKYSESQDLVYEAMKAIDNDPGAVRVMIKGKPYRVLLKDDRMAKAIKNLGAEQLPGVFKLLGSINRYFSAVLTRYNPAFVPINMIRDLGLGIIGITSEYGMKQGAQAAWNYLPAMRALWREARGKASNSQTMTYAKEYKDNGGRTGFQKYENVEEIAQALNDEFKGFVQLMKEKKPYYYIKRTLRDSKTVKLIEDANDTIENTMRLAAFIARRKAGASPETAAEYAKNITVNFNRRGHQTGWINSSFLFFNAATQGSTRTFQLLKQPKVLATMGAMASLQFVFGMLAMGADDEDEDGVTAWEKISDQEKLRNFIIPVVGEKNGKMTVKLVKIPMPYGFNFFTYLGGRLAQATNSKDEADITSLTNDLGVAAIDAVSPLKFTDGMQGMKPYLMKIFDSIGYNENDFGSDITSEQPYARYEIPRASLGRASTPEPYHIAAKALNTLGGGDEVTKPRILENFTDRSPEDLRFLTEAFGGGLLRTGTQAYSAGQKGFAGVDLSFNDIPILKSLFSEVDMERATQDRYYKLRERIARETARVKIAFEKDGVEAARELLSKTPELKGYKLHRFETGKYTNKNGEIQLEAVNEKDGDASLAKEFKAAEKALGDIADRINTVRSDRDKSMTDRIREIEALEKEREAAQRKLNVKWSGKNG